mmetsp:Transcript_21468/g.59530  ORF Transcript_21468/g.59530 Transcript_21468/m.59530 type:complete len:91 (+) Transcript_21468:2119-2391(+)
MELRRSEKMESRTPEARFIAELPLLVPPEVLLATIELLPDMRCLAFCLGVADDRLIEDRCEFLLALVPSLGNGTNWVSRSNNWGRLGTRV